MKGKCDSCGKIMNLNVLEHGVFRGNFIQGHKDIKCDGKLQIMGLSKTKEE